MRRGTWIVKGNKKWQKHSTVHKQKSANSKATRMEFLEKGCLMIDRLTFKYVTFIFSLGCAQLQGQPRTFNFYHHRIGYVLLS